MSTLIRAHPEIPPMIFYKDRKYSYEDVYGDKWKSYLNLFL